MSGSRRSSERKAVQKAINESLRPTTVPAPHDSGSLVSSTGSKRKAVSQRAASKKQKLSLSKDKATKPKAKRAAQAKKTSPKNQRLSLGTDDEVDEAESDLPDMSDAPTKQQARGSSPVSDISTLTEFSSSPPSPSVTPTQTDQPADVVSSAADLEPAAAISVESPLQEQPVSSNSVEPALETEEIQQLSSLQNSEWQDAPPFTQYDQGAAMPLLPLSPNSDQTKNQEANSHPSQSPHTPTLNDAQTMAITLPTPASMQPARSPTDSVISPTFRQSGRSRKLPMRFGDYASTSEVIQSEAALEEVEEVEEAEEEVVEAEANIEAEESGDEVDTTPAKKPAAKKAPAKRAPKKKAEPEVTERSKVLKLRISPMKLKDWTDRISKESAPVAKRGRAKKAVAVPTEDSTMIVSPEAVPAVKRSRPAKAAAKPSKPSKPSNAVPTATEEDFVASFDPALLALSRAMTARKPLGEKPLPHGKPEVWAPGRQEICETLPYAKMPQGGSYQNGGTVYGFLFDAIGHCREYMDEDVVIARSGGKMSKDPKTQESFQNDDHELKSKQVRAVMNNIKQQNPVIIVCGDRNAGTAAAMPHKYCVLSWYKIVAVWTEKTRGKGRKAYKTIKYRFERLNSSGQPAWFAPAESDQLPEAEGADILQSATCIHCKKEWPQIYLVGWMCLHADCSELWKLSNGEDAPYGKLDYNPAFLRSRTPWTVEEEPFPLSLSVPDMNKTFGDTLSYISTRGIVCPVCRRCNSRYLYSGWRCDTQGCNWSLTPDKELIPPNNLGHTPWDVTSTGPALVKMQSAPDVQIEIRYSHGYKIMRYTFPGVTGSVILAKPSKRVVEEAGGANDMFAELQMSDIGLERRLFRASKIKKRDPSMPSNEESEELADEEEPANDDDDDGPTEVDDNFEGEVGSRMLAFGGNFGFPYKFIASGDSVSFEEAIEAIRDSRSRLNWAQRCFLNNPAGDMDFNENLVFAYLEGQMINYHDDGEEGLGPRIATLSLGGAARMSLRLKPRYFTGVSQSGNFYGDKPVPFALMENSGYLAKSMKLSGKDTYAGRVAAYNEVQHLKTTDKALYNQRVKEIPKELGLSKKKQPHELLSFHLTHGDIVIMEGEDVQKYLEHQVQPKSSLRYALTCRTILPHHLKKDEMPDYEVKPDDGGYDGAGIRMPGDTEKVVW